MRKFNFETANWDQPAKIEYRRRSIIEPYRWYFKTDKLASHLYYWSICGNNSEAGIPQTNSEIGQMVGEGLIKTHQFVGVDRSPHIIENNRLAWNEATWKHGEFSDILHNLISMKPGIIHADTTVMSNNAIGVLEDIVSIVENVDNPCMVVLNTVTKRWIDSYTQTLSEIMPRIESLFLREGWLILNSNEDRGVPLYEYSGGLSSSKARMATNVFLFVGTND